MQDNNIIQEAINTLKRLHKKNAELKAENERLKEEIIHQRKLNQELIIKYIKPITVPTLNTELFDENYKLKQTLQEIKEIAERGFYNSQCNCGLRADIEQILQKITKAESEG